MAKKTSRPNLPQETLERARRDMARNGEVAEVVQTPAPTADGMPAPAVVVQKPKREIYEVDLGKEYAYVVNDLRTVGTLAAGFMVVLIALSFFL
jgi:hypothetical protein